MNTYAYVGNNPINGVDPWGLEVVIQGSSTSVTKALSSAYNRIKNRSSKAAELCKTLEDSSQKYFITDKANNLIQNGDRASYSELYRTIVTDPKYHPILNTERGPQRASTDIILGHEIGHAATGIDDGPSEDRMENVNANENPIRGDLGLPQRTKYP